MGTEMVSFVLSYLAKPKLDSGPKTYGPQTFNDVMWSLGIGTSCMS